MARVKKTKQQLRQHHKRTSWTRFYLPRGQDWPTWPSTAGHSDADAKTAAHLGPLAGMAGCQKVWLGRKADDPEQAALIVLWESAESLKKFQDSPACGEFLQGLPENQGDKQVSLLQNLSLKDDTDAQDAADSDDTSLPSSLPFAPSSSSRFLSFQWSSGYRFEENLQGRVTLTALAIPYPDSDTEVVCAPAPTPVIPESWCRTVYSAFGDFLPSGCEDLRAQWPRSRMHFWTAWAWVDMDTGAVAGDKSGRQAVLCEFRRWNGYSGATPEREEASARSPLARESWARTVARVMPPVTAWEQERWDIQLAPGFGALEEDEEEGGEQDVEDAEDAEYERNMEEFLKQQRLPQR